MNFYCLAFFSTDPVYFPYVCNDDSGASVNTASLLTSSSSVEAFQTWHRLMTGCLEVFQIHQAIRVSLIAQAGQKKLDYMEKVEETLHRLNYEVKRVEGDGNCLFRAVSYHVHGDDNMHAEVRGKCMRFLDTQKEECFRGAWKHLHDINEDVWQAYIDKMSVPGTYNWGGPIEVQAMATVYKLYIHVVMCFDTPDGPNPIGKRTAGSISFS